MVVLTVVRSTQQRFRSINLTDQHPITLFMPSKRACRSLIKFITLWEHRVRLQRFMMQTNWVKTAYCSQFGWRGPPSSSSMRKRFGTTIFHSPIAYSKFRESFNNVSPLSYLFLIHSSLKRIGDIHQ